MVEPNGSGNGKAKSTWTIMMYINADPTLANFAVQSLKELQAAATAEIVVAAQFGSDGERDIPRLIFNGKDKYCPFEVNTRGKIARGTDMANPTALGDFIDWVCEQPECKETKHWALVLWGHGPELLFDDYVSPVTHQERKSFLTPSTLGKALKHTRFGDGAHKLDMVAIDACNMSMVEAAYELGQYAEFLVASQDDVPDFSFPYGSLLRLFSESTCSEHEIANVCRQLPKRYITAYEDYIHTRQAAMPNITLASIRLASVEQVIRPLDTLADILMKAVSDPRKREAIISARANSKGFVAGLYADLCHFCEQLRIQYSAEHLLDPELTAACKSICGAIQARDGHACVIANESQRDMRCHGLSVYFPYFTDEDQASFATSSAPLVKGGLEILQKGGLEILQKGGLEILQKGGFAVPETLNSLRRQRIEETENYYYGLDFAKNTGWDEFIRYGWSRCLAEEAAAKVTEFPPQNRLDQRYSAEQCALNLLSLCREPEEKDPALEKRLAEPGEHGMGPSVEPSKKRSDAHGKANGRGRHVRTQRTERHVNGRL